MDSDIVRWAYNFSSLVEKKHQYARSIDVSTRQLIQLVISQSKPPADKKEPYAPTREAFQADLLAFARIVFQQLSKPPPPPPDITKALKAYTSAIDKIVGVHAGRLADHIDQCQRGNTECFRQLGV